MLSWLTNLANLLQNWMLNPYLFLGGAALLAAPIIIHLLNKRKFRTVDWAAIEFLLEADKKNRRRIRLENWLLLLLRCMAVLLVALFLARPFRPQSFAGGALQSVRFERIVVLDDSLSMQAVKDGRSAFDVGKQAIADLINSLRSVDADESLSVVLMSKPERPVMRGVQLNNNTVEDLVRDIQALEQSDAPVRMDDVLLEIEKLMRAEPEYVNRVIYLVSDLRVRDWNFAESVKEQGARETLHRIAKKAVGCYIVDAGSADVLRNLVVSNVVPKEKVLVAGVSSTFDVTVVNHSPAEVRNVDVGFSAGESLPLAQRIERIAANSSETIPFSFTFVPPHATSLELSSNSSDRVSQQMAIRVSIQANEQPHLDQLPADNERFLAARVEPGVRTLIVDGDPSALYSKSESFSLKRSLVPPGDQLSGVVVEVVTDVEFDKISLDSFHVVYLCNLYRLTDERRVALEKWVSSGGGLVIFPGDQIDEHVYNDTLYRDGTGLLPARLTTVFGDESEEKWVHMRVPSSNHPALSVFDGENNPFASWVKFFRWWGVDVNEQQLASGEVLVSARFSDTQNSPAVVEKRLGEGRVILIATTADRDWNNWPLDPSFVIFSQELTRYLVTNADRQNTIDLGQSIRFPLNLTEYKRDVSLRDPSQTIHLLDPKPSESAEASKANEAQWVVDYAGADRRGFYELNLLRLNGMSHKVTFAANVDQSESDLRRVDLAELKRNLSDDPIEIVSAQKLTATSAKGAEAELWPLILCLAVVTLCSEQVLGWFFGRQR